MSIPDYFLPVKGQVDNAAKDRSSYRYETDCTPNLKAITVDDQYLIKKDPVLLRPTSGANAAMPQRIAYAQLKEPGMASETAVFF